MHFCFIFALDYHRLLSRTSISYDLASLTYCWRVSGSNGSALMVPVARGYLLQAAAKINGDVNVTMHDDPYHVT